MASDIEGSGRIFGPAIRKTNLRTSLFALDNDRFNQHYKCNSNIESMYATSRAFGLGLKSSVFGSNRQNDGGLIQESDNSNKYNQASISSLSRPFESRLRHEKFKLGYSVENNDRLNDNYRSRVDQSISMAPRLFGSYSAMDVNSNMEGNVKLDQQLYVTNYKGNDQINMSSMCRSLEPSSKNTSWSTGIRIQENLGLAYGGSSNGGFRRPIASKVIKGRNSTMSSRLFSYPNMERNTKNLSNINGFNVSHISRRGLDTLSEIKHPLDGRHNWMDNRSVSGSVLSVTSAKAQFMNLLENLQHSILRIVPNLPDSVKVEFDKVKEGLENINEMSIAPVKEADGTSIISYSSRFICPQILDHTSAKVLDISSIPLKTGQNILRSFSSNRLNTTNETNLLPEDEEENEKGMNPSIAAASRSMSFEEDSALLFKKPKPYSKRKRNSHSLKIKTPQVTKHLASNTKNTAMSLKQWYPIAVERNLEFCGINENGAILRTEAMKKRINNRRIELSNGIVCNLVGSPDTLVSAFPKKVISMLKNGLTDRWRVLQKELLDYQTNKNEIEIKESENSKLKCKEKSSPLKKVKNTLSPSRTDEKKLKRPGRKPSPGEKYVTVISPSINKSVRTVQTRSGRTVKRPVLFSIDFGHKELSSEFMLQSSKKDSSVVETLVKKSKNTDHGISNVKIKKSPSENIKKRLIGSPVKKSKACCKLAPGKKSKKIVSPKTSRITSPKKGLKNDKEESIGDAATVHSTTEVGSQESRAKRKRKMVGDADSTQKKKSRPENKMEAEVESTVADGEPPTGTLKKNKRRSTDSGKRSSGTTNKKQQKATRSKMKKASNKKNIINQESELIKEKQNRSDWEGDFELLLDDIKIPEIGNISSKPQLSRSQLKIVGMETPPLKYFNNNLRMLRSATPVQSPEWSISQRTESEVKQFQKRRAEAHKKKITVEVRRSVVKEKGKTHVQSRDLKNVLDWVAEKNMRSPQWNSRVLQYVIPSRKQIEEEDEYEEDDNMETRFFPQ